ncbi:MAG: T9SS type A sorting domain-containing protein [Ignavibacteria bacterium]
MGLPQPDTSIRIGGYDYVNFVNKNNGWAYYPLSGIHTNIGGDTTIYTGIVKQTAVIPEDFSLHQNYPNPFNPRTIIPFSLKKSAFVKLTAFDITGKEVQNLVNGRYEAGEYEVDFMGKFMPSGVYFYRIEIPDNNSGIYYTETKSMMLIK